MILEDYQIFGIDQTTFIIIGVVILLFVLVSIFFLSGLIHIEKDEVVIIEKRHKYFKTLNSGFNFVVPILHEIHSYVSLSNNCIEGKYESEKYFVSYFIKYDVNDPVDYAYKKDLIETQLIELLKSSIEENYNQNSYNLFESIKDKSKSINSIQVTSAYFVNEEKNNDF